MKQLTYLIFGLLFTATGYGQVASYDISKFVFPDVQRRTLAASPFIDLYASKFSTSTASSIDINLPISGTETNYNRKKQLDIIYALNVGYTDLSENYSNGRNQNKLYGKASIDLEKRLFFQPKRFFELELGSKYAYDKNVHHTSFENSNEKDLELSLSPKIGFGRIEIVTDAWHAATIVEDLQIAGTLKKDLSHEEITSLANLISLLRNSRNVDSRLESIYEFENLAKHFVDNEYVDGDQYGFFAALKDLYDFEGFVVRKHGSQFTSGIDLSYEFLDPDSDFSEIWKSKNYSIVAEFEKNRAISSNWQFDQSYKLQAGLLSNNRPSYTEAESYLYGRLSASYNLGYFPSQRTFFNLHAQALFNIEDTERSHDIINVYVTPQVSYYISPQLRFNVFANLNLREINWGSGDFDSHTSARLITSINYFFY